MTVGMPYWWTNKEWYTYDPKKGHYVLTDKAPPEAVKSYEEYYGKDLKKKYELL